MRKICGWPIGEDKDKKPILCGKKVPKRYIMSHFKYHAKKAGKESIQRETV